MADADETPPAIDPDDPIAMSEQFFAAAGADPLTTTPAPRKVLGKFQPAKPASPPPPPPTPPPAPAPAADAPHEMTEEEMIAAMQAALDAVDANPLPLPPGREDPAKAAEATAAVASGPREPANFPWSIFAVACLLVGTVSGVTLNAVLNPPGKHPKHDESSHDSHDSHDSSGHKEPGTGHSNDKLYEEVDFAIRSGKYAEALELIEESQDHGDAHAGGHATADAHGHAPAADHDKTTPKEQKLEPAMAYRQALCREGLKKWRQAALAYDQAADRDGDISNWGVATLGQVRCAIALSDLETAARLLSSVVLQSGRTGVRRFVVDECLYLRLQLELLKTGRRPAPDPLDDLAMSWPSLQSKPDRLLDQLPFEHPHGKGHGHPPSGADHPADDHGHDAKPKDDHAPKQPADDHAPKKPADDHGHDAKPKDDHAPKKPADDHGHDAKPKDPPKKAADPHGHMARLSVRILARKPEDDHAPKKPVDDHAPAAAPKAAKPPAPRVMPVEKPGGLIVDRYGEDVELYEVTSHRSGAPILTHLQSLCKELALNLKVPADLSSLLQSRTTPLEIEYLLVGEMLSALLTPVNMTWSIEDKNLIIQRDSDSESSQPARSAARRAMIGAPKHPLLRAAWITMANLDAEIDGSRAAINTYKQFLELHPHSVEARDASYNLGLHHLRNGETVNAKKRFMDVVDRSEKGRWVDLGWWWIGRCSLDNSDIELSLKYFRILLDSDFPEIRAAAMIGIASCHLFNDATDDGRIVLKKQRPAAGMPQELAQTLQYWFQYKVAPTPGRAERVFESLKSSHHLRALGPMGLFLSGRIYQELDAQTQMVDLYSAAVLQYRGPVVIRMTFEVAEYWYNLDRRDAAKQRYLAIVAIDPEGFGVRALARLADLAVRERDPKTSLKAARQYLSKPGADPSEVLAVMGRAYEQLGKYQLAAECFAGQVPRD